MIVKPFRGLRPRADLADRIPSVPYDVVSSDEARRLVRDDPHSFLHVIRPEVDLDPGIDPQDDRVYAKGRENFRGMIERDWIARDEAPAYYVYRLEMDGHRQTGIVGAAAVDDYLQDRIKKHEHTRPDKEKDRVRLIDALSAHPGPVFLTYRGLPEMNALINAVVAGEPEVRFTSSDGVRHELWVVADAAACDRIEALFASVRHSYVADGHHRTAAAAKVCEQGRQRLESPSGAEPCNYFLAAHFPAEQLKVLEYNRVVRDLNGLSAEELVERIRGAGFDVVEGHRGKSAPHRRSFGMYLDRRWHLLTPSAEISASDDVVEGLDVRILSRHLLEPILGVGDPRTDKRIDFVGGIRGTTELEKRVDSGEGAVAFALYPTALDDVMLVADADGVMPPKSTWFEPKLRSGMVVQSLEGDSL